MMFEHDRDIKIEKVRNDKVTITIDHEYQMTREFAIIIGEDGLHISSDVARLVVRLHSSASLQVDYDDQ